MPVKRCPESRHLDGPEARRYNGSPVRQTRGLVAQGIERLRPKEGVGGSSPSEAANILNLNRPGFPMKAVL